MSSFEEFSGLEGWKRDSAPFLRQGRQNDRAIRFARFKILVGKIRADPPRRGCVFCFAMLDDAMVDTFEDFDQENV